jgi:hypothetical protein
MFSAEMAFERAFVAAGGLLLAGCDPAGNRGNPHRDSKRRAISGRSAGNVHATKYLHQLAARREQINRSDEDELPFDIPDLPDPEA